MTRIPYDKDDLLSINVAFKCDILGYYTAFMLCPECRHYPCRQLTVQDIEMLNASPLMDKIPQTLTPGRINTVYIARKNDGSLEILEDLDEKNPAPEQLRDVEEIYVITKTLVPVMTLKPKPKKEQDQIIASAASGKSATGNKAKKAKT